MQSIDYVFSKWKPHTRQLYQLLRKHPCAYDLKRKMRLCGAEQMMLFLRVAASLWAFALRVA
jgi:hypothetical protein